MPWAPKRFIPPGYRTPLERDQPSRQDPKRAIYASAAWRQLRVAVVHRDNGLCQICLKAGKTTPVVLGAKRGTSQRMAIVDHIIPAVTADDVLCDMSNLQTLCPKCANSKTASQDGGYGNRKRAGHVEK